MQSSSNKHSRSKKLQNKTFSSNIYNENILGYLLSNITKIGYFIRVATIFGIRAIIKAISGKKISTNCSKHDPLNMCCCCLSLISRGHLHTVILSLSFTKLTCKIALNFKFTKKEKKMYNLYKNVFTIGPY